MSKTNIQFTVIPGSDEIFHASDIGLEMGREMKPIERATWLKMMIEFRAQHNRSQFVLGDLLNLGIEAFGEEIESTDGTRRRRLDYLVAAEACGMEIQTLYDFASVCRQVPLARRNGRLTFNHHRAVAPLAADQQKKFLAAAERDGLNVADLRQLIRRSSTKFDLPKATAEKSRLAAWFAEGYRLLAAEAPDTWGPERREAFAAQWRRLGEVAQPFLS